MAFKDIYYDSDADELVVVDDDGSPAALRSGSLTTEEARVGSRNLVSPSENINVYVSTTGSDESGDGSESNPWRTIEKAVSEGYNYNVGWYIIHLDDGVYDEDVVLPGTTTTSDKEYEETGTSSTIGGFGVRLTGDQSAPGNVSVKSIAASGFFGTASLRVDGVEIYGQSPYENEGTGMAVYGSQGVRVKDCIISPESSGTNGIVWYNSTNNQVTDCEFEAKSGNLESYVLAKSQSSGEVVGCSGSINHDWAFKVLGSHVRADMNNLDSGSAPTDNGIAQVRGTQSIFYESETRQWITVNDGDGKPSVQFGATEIDGMLVERVDGYVQSGTTTSEVEVSFEGLNPDSRYLIKFDIGMRDTTSGELLININEDDDEGNEEYTWFDETGSKQEGQDEIVLVDVSSRTEIGGHITVTTGKDVTDARQVGLDNSLAIARLSHTNGFAQKGSYEGFDDAFGSIQITSTIGLQDESTIEIWEAIV